MMTCDPFQRDGQGLTKSSNPVRHGGCVPHALAVFVLLINTQLQHGKGSVICSDASNRLIQYDHFFQ